jgi:hypothetical protein
VAGHHGGGDVSGGLVFEHIAGAQADHAYMLLAIVAVHGSRLENFRREVLQGRCGRNDSFAAGLAHAHVVDGERFEGGVVAEDELAKLLHRSFVLHVDEGGCDVGASAIGLVAKAVGDEIEDDGFLGGISGGGNWCRRRGLGGGENAEGDG